MLYSRDLIVIISCRRGPIMIYVRFTSINHPGTHVIPQVHHQVEQTGGRVQGSSNPEHQAIVLQTDEVAQSRTSGSISYPLSVRLQAELATCEQSASMR